MSEQGEFHCAETFAKKESEPDSTLVRAEIEFPDLVGNPRWDYVLKHIDGSWDAIEIKSLVVAEIPKELSGWKGIWGAVEKELFDQLDGEYSSLGNPEWFPTQSQRSALVPAIAAAAIKLLPDLSEGAIANLGPPIQDAFTDWPKGIPRTEWKGEQFDLSAGIEVVYPPVELQVVKWKSDGPFTIEAGSARPVIFTPGASSQELSKDLIKANGQLAVATSYGANKRYVLLDDHRISPPDQISQTLSMYEFDELPHVNSVYLVRSGSGQVAKVWGS